MKRPEGWRFLEFLAVFTALISFSSVTGRTCYRSLLSPPTFIEQVGDDPVAFITLMVSLGFIAYSTLKLNLPFILRRKP
jgi:hypothetical protein